MTSETRERDKERDNLLYLRELESFKSYHASYGASEMHFQLSESTKLFIRQLIEAGYLKFVRSILEVGCGQGAFLNFTQQALQEAYAHRVEGLGVDGSHVGIRQSAERFPQLCWIADDVRHFAATLERGEGDPSSPWYQLNFDLILDQTGLTAITDYQEARDTFRVLHQHLNQPGAYLYIASKGFYQTCCERYRQNGWPHDKLALLKTRFPYVIVGDDDHELGYYKRLYLSQDPRDPT